MQQIQAISLGVFAAILDSGAVATWGDPRFGGDSSQVQELLVIVQQIQSTGFAFAAILDSGAVVTWVDADGSDKSSQVQEPLRCIYIYIAIKSVPGSPAFEGHMENPSFFQYLVSAEKIQKNKTKQRKCDVPG